MYQALYRKWRPKTFDDVVGQSHITQTLRRQVETGRLSHAYLFTGTRGTGKTTCAKILSKAVNCTQPVRGNPCNCCNSCRGIDNGSILDVLEIDAASNNGVDHIRALRDDAIYSPAAVTKRVYIIDEVHMLSTPAFNALLKILEEPPAHLIFILATTEIHKVPATIKSRCQQFAFKRIAPQAISEHLQMVAEKESIPLTRPASDLLSRLADGGLRDALSLLDQCSGSDGDLDETVVLNTLGLAGSRKTAQILQAAADGDSSAALAVLDELYRDGKDMGSFLSEVSNLVRDLLIRKTAPQGGTGLLTGGYPEEIIQSLQDSYTASELIQCLTIIQNAQSEMYRSTNRRLDAELCIIRLCDRSLADSADGILARLSRLEKQLASGVITVSQAPEQPAQAPRKAPKAAVPAQKPAAAAAPPVQPAEILPEPDRKPESPAPMPPAEEAVTPVTKTTSTTSAKPAPVSETPAAEVPSEPPAAKKPAAKPARIATANPSWSDFLKFSKKNLPAGTYTTLSKDGNSGEFDGDTLTIWFCFKLYKDTCSVEMSKKAIQDAANAFLGRPVRLQMKLTSEREPVRKPSPSGQALMDRIETYSQQFDNFTVK